MVSTQTKQFKFTKSKLDKLPSPSSGVQYYNDSEEKGLKLYITTNGSITFCYRKKNGWRIILFGFVYVSFLND